MYRSPNRLSRTYHWRTAVGLCALLSLTGLFLALALPRTAYALGSRECPILQPDGVNLITENTNEGPIYIVCVDLRKSNLRFETVLANDVLNVNAHPDQRERVVDIVEREPYKSRRPIIAFNADYFGPGHGAQGLTIKNGFRIDGAYSGDNDGEETDQPSLSISRLNRVDISRKSAAAVVDHILQLTSLYNSVGGGPTLVRNGQVISNPCSLEGGDCTDSQHTAVGVSADGQTLIILVSQAQKTGQEIGEYIHSYGAQWAMKLDGGGSSQLWYRGDTKVSGDGRGVADAMLIFLEPTRRHDAIISFQNEFPIVQPGAAFDLTFRIANRGFLTWVGNLGYGLAHTNGESVGLPAWHPLATTVPYNAEIEWHLYGTAPQTVGVYQTRWQMAYRDPDSGVEETFGPEISYLITVLPEGSSQDLANAIRQIIDQSLQEAGEQIDQALADLQRQIEERLQEELRRRLPPWAQCLTGPGIVITGLGLAAFGRRGRRK